MCMLAVRLAQEVEGGGGITGLPSSAAMRACNSLTRVRSSVIWVFACADTKSGAASSTAKIATVPKRCAKDIKIESLEIRLLYEYCSIPLDKSNAKKTAPWITGAAGQSPPQKWQMGRH